MHLCIARALPIALASLVISSLLASSAVVPRQKFSTDVNQQVKPRPLKMVQLSSWELLWQFKEARVAKDITAADRVIFDYSPSNLAWTVSVTGAVHLATNGQVLVTFTPANLNTNGAFKWRLEVIDDGLGVTMATAFGALTIEPDWGGSAGSPAFLTSTNVDFATVANYANVTNGGAYVAGSNITLRTGAGNGRVYIDGVSSAASVTNDPNLMRLNVAGTITANHVNTANPWADNEVADTLTIGAASTVADGAIPAAITRDTEIDTLSKINALTTDVDAWAADGSVTGVASSVHNFSGGTLSNVATLVSQTNLSLHLEARDSAGVVAASYRATPSGALIAVAATNDSITLQQGEASATLKMTNNVTDIVNGEFHIGGESIGFADGAANEVGDPIDYTQIKNVPTTLFNIGTGAESDPTVAGATNALDVALRALTNTAGSVNNSGSTFIQDAILDARGNITNWVSAVADLQSVTASGATTDIKITLTNDLMLVSNIVDTAGHKILAAKDGEQAIYYDGGAVYFMDLGTSYRMQWQNDNVFMDLGTTFSMYDSAGNVFMDLGNGTEGLYFNNGLIAIDLGITNHLATTNGIVLVDLTTGLITNATVALATGATVNEFSIDGTLAGNSDAAVPTEKAVKTYVDAAGGGGDPAAWWYATMSADMVNIPDSVETPIAYNTIVQTNGCNYNTTTYTATNIPNGVYMFMLQIRAEDFDTQKWGRFIFNAIGGYELTENFRYHEPENSTADLQNQAFESVYVVTNGNGACYASWKTGDTQDDNDIGTAGSFFSGIRIHDYP